MHERLARGDVVAVYAARDGELDLAPVTASCWRRGIAVALPVLAGRAMFFSPYREGAPLRRSRYGILEPAPPAGRAEPPAVIPSVVLAPVVAFDAAGNRLGMGGGYYDRYFAANPDALRLGVAHACQLAPWLPTHAEDVPLAAVATEQGWRVFGV